MPLLQSALIFINLFLILPLMSAETPKNGSMPLSSYSYACTYFDGENKTGLKLALSKDGFAWESVPVDFSPSVGNWKIFRDPSFLQSPDGTFHLVWTTGSDGFGYATSKDLLSWSNPRYISTNRGATRGNPTYTWAPELFWDASGERLGVLVTVATRTWEGPLWEGNFHTFVLYQENNDTFTDPVPFFDPHLPFYEIDAAVIDFKGETFCFFKIEDANIQTPTKEKDGIHYVKRRGGAASWSAPSRERLPKNVPNSEGPSPVIIDGALVVFYDNVPGMGAARSIDGESWEDISDKLKPPPGFRHGTVRFIRTGVGRD